MRALEGLWAEERLHLTRAHGLPLAVAVGSQGGQFILQPMTVAGVGQLEHVVWEGISKEANEKQL